MEHARIIVVQDYLLDRYIHRLCCQEFGHVLLGEADTAADAKRLVDGLKPGEVDVAIVDGELGTSVRRKTDGEEVGAYIHAKLPGVTVIGTSLDGNVRGADVSFPKENVEGLYLEIKIL